ncbi:arginase family protein [Pseudooceanicola sp. CBS1P-1]|uniref:Arginase n=1 Tax=Pseudooceanicola albus TaxID=2692189 RepID=A0A6L7G4F1_9RHOB|nr:MULTISPECIES: arginase family protein [Pseudooceanicola]MBT9385146.1 arginase family protein [Pseudooceanicola endophyticus]MXN18562.1 arginase [Pseudooceanicola albus]
MTSSPNLGALYGAAGTETTFLGLAAAPELSAVTAPMALIGAPGATPYASVGSYCAEGPDALRLATRAFTANLDHHDFDLGGRLFPRPELRAVDCGNLPHQEGQPAANREAIRTAIATLLERGAVPLLMGGDDSVPIPMLEAVNARAAAEGRKLTVLQIDAHIDWRDSHMDETQGLSSTMRRASELSQVERIVQVGARGIGSAGVNDVADALAWGVTFVPGRTFHRIGAAAVLEMIPRGADVVICIDADALDPGILPGVIGRAPGGLSYGDVCDLIEGVAARGRIRAMDFVEFMPERDVDGIGALTFARIIMTSMGVIARAVDAG